MNLTSNQEEVEKENDYYAQQRPTSPTASPALSPPIERLLVYKKIIINN